MTTMTRPTSSAASREAGPAVPAIEVSDLTVAYRDRPVLWDVDLTVPQGILMAVCGPNGAGKTTMMKAILGLLKPVAGEIKILGGSYEANRHLVGYVPQRGSVDWDFPTSVLDVVMMGRYGALGWFRRPGQAERRAAQETLSQVGMESFAERQISQLSGGQQQRVFLARALVQGAGVYLMDEPFQGVDATTERAIVELLRTLRAAGKTVVAVHHDLQTVGEYFDSVTLLNVRKVASGPVGAVFTEQNLRLTFGGRVAFLTRDARPGDVRELAPAGESFPRGNPVEPSPNPGRGQGEGQTASHDGSDEGPLPPSHVATVAPARSLSSSEVKGGRLSSDEDPLTPDLSPRGEGVTSSAVGAAVGDLPSPPAPLPIMGEGSDGVDPRPIMGEGSERVATSAEERAEGLLPSHGSAGAHPQPLSPGRGGDEGLRRG